MTEIKIWSDQQISIYDHPPNFNSIQRKKFLTLPVKLKKRVDTFYTIANKVGFHLMYGYFKARRRFFLTERFKPVDIQFVSRRLGLLFADGLLESYNRKTYNRHRQIILAHFGYDAFQLQKHHPLILQLVDKSLWSFDRTHLLLGNILGWLEYRHIELPSYYALPNEKIIPISEVLATIDRLTNYLDEFKHYQPYYRKQRPSKNVFFVNIMAFGCNLGVEKMAKVARSVTTTQLENTANWHFDLENIQKATNTINNFMDKLELPNLFRKKKGELHTSSDGQKIGVASDSTIDAHYSFKYFGSGKGVTSYAFIDERFIPFYSTIINTTEREAIYVVDGLLHNEAISSTIHSTDTHGYTEAVFGLMDILGFGFAPRIAKLHHQQLYSFEKIADYKAQGYHVLPDGYINVELIEENWDAILRLVTSIKLKHCSASQIFKRLNSYSRQHPVYQALKEYGRIIKTIYILRYIDLLELRQAIQKQLNVVELSNRFSSAVSIANGGEMLFLTHREQLISDACKNLIKSAITCWNYLFMTRHIQSIKDVKEKEEIIKAIKPGTAIAWRYIYFNGLYDFSAEKLADSFNLLSSQNYDLNLE